MGMSISQMKQYLPYSEYTLFQKYFMLYGIGQEADYVRSANLINVISNYISGAVGGKPPNHTAEDIYPQLSYSEMKRRGKNDLVKWDRIDERMRQQLIEAGLFTEDGEPVASNPHRR